MPVSTPTATPVVPPEPLAVWARKQAPLAAREVVGLMLDVLDGLVPGHAQGLACNGLSMEDVTVDVYGRANFRPPEKVPVAARRSLAQARDVFSVAVLLAELLQGSPLHAGVSIDQLHELVRIRGLVPNWDPVGDCPPGLRATVTQALTAVPVSAVSLRAQLQQWLIEDLEVPDTEAASRGRFGVLLLRMRKLGDFPALSSAVARIQSISSSDKESLATLTNEILKDVALTNRLLRLVNTVHYARGSSISTVSRAVSLVGFNGIRNMTLGLMLLDHMPDKGHAELLKDEFLRALMAGSIARELNPLQEDAEEAFIGAMFQNLGRLLTEYYFPQEARAIHELLAKAPAPSEAHASAQVLGLSFEQLGSGIARAWKLPEVIQRCMRRPVASPPGQTPQDPQERLRWIATVSNEMVEVLLLEDDAGSANARLAQIGARYARGMGCNSQQIMPGIAKAREKLLELVEVMDLQATPDSRSARLLRQLTPTLPEELPASSQARAALSSGAEPSDPRVVEMLMAGIQDITNSMVDDFNLTDVLRMILETMLRALDFRYIVFCLRDPRAERLSGRLGLGRNVDHVVRGFEVSLSSAATDLFATVCGKGADTLISDAADPRIAERLPSWYRKSVDAPTFLLLPLSLKGRPIGLIYADKNEPGGLRLGDRELSLLRTLRNQAVMAVRQSG